MPNTLPIALSNAKNAVKLLDRALNDLEYHYSGSGFDRDKLQTVHQISSNNSNIQYKLERL